MVRMNGRRYSPLKNCFVLTPSNTEFPPLPPPRINTELEDKETGQESESIILRSSKNQTDLIRTPRTMKRPPSTTEVSSTRSKSNIIIRRPTKYDSPIKPPPTKKNKSQAHIDSCCTCGYKSKCTTSQCSCKAAGHACLNCQSYCCKNGTGSETVPVDLSLCKTPPPRSKKKVKQRNLATLVNEFSPTKVV